MIEAGRAAVVPDGSPTGSDGGSASRSPALRFPPAAVAPSAVVAALLATLFLNDVLGVRATFSLFLMSVMASAWYAGARAGLAATILGGLAADFFLLEPPRAFSFTSGAWAETARLVLFLASGGVATALCAAVHAAHVRAHEAEAKAADERRRGAELEARTRALVDRLKDHAVFEVDDDTGTIRTWSAGAERLLDYAAADIIGRPLSHLYSPDDGSVPAARLLEAAGSLPRLEARTWWMRRFGSRVHVELVLTPLRRASGERHGVSVIARDLTPERELAEARERLLDRVDTSRAALEAVLRLVPAGVIVADAEGGRLLHGNAAVERIWRRSPPGVTAAVKYRDLEGIAPDGRRYAPEDWPIARSMARGESVEDESVALVRGDGTLGALRVSSAPVRCRDGRVVAGVMVLVDAEVARAWRGDVMAEAVVNEGAQDVSVPAGPRSSP